MTDPRPTPARSRLLALVGRRAFLIMGTALLIVLPPFLNAYFVYAMNLALIYVILAVGLNFVIGFAG